MSINSIARDSLAFNKFNRQRKCIILVAACMIIFAMAMAADVPLAYVLGPGDEVALWALGAEEISAHPIRVDPSGFIDVPLIGHFQAGGLTVEQLREELTRRLQAQIRRPQVSISITEFRSQPVSVLGAVNKPGTYQLQGQKTLLEALSLAEGFATTQATPSGLCEVWTKVRSRSPALEKI